jgi:hypothetical protein
MFKTTGRRGNYQVLICGASVHNSSGKEYRINADKTIDWRHAVIEPVGPASGKRPESVRKLSGYRELRSENGEGEELKPRAAKPAAPGDLRFQSFINYAHESYTAKHGTKPLWQGKDFKALQTSLRSHSSESLPLERLKILWEHFAASTEPFTAKQGDSLAYFCANLGKFSDGPIWAGKAGTNGKGNAISITEQNMRNLGFAGPNVASGAG